MKMKNLMCIFFVLCVVHLSIQKKTCSCPERKKILVRQNDTIALAFPIMRYTPCVIDNGLTKTNYMIICLDDKATALISKKSSDSKITSVGKKLIDNYMSDWEKKDIEKFQFRNQRDTNTLFTINVKDKYGLRIKVKPNDFIEDYLRMYALSRGYDNLQY